MPTAFTTAMLAWGLLAFPSGYSDAGHTEAALDSVRWGTDYLLKIVRPGNIKQTLNTGYTIVYQVGDELQKLTPFDSVHMCSAHPWDLHLAWLASPVIRLERSAAVAYSL